jgi:glycogen synthase
MNCTSCSAAQVCVDTAAAAVWLLLQADDCERYMFFSRAALEFLLVMDRQPDVLHLHDWQSALVVSAWVRQTCQLHAE